jgi:hypothetical protein
LLITLVSKDLVCSGENKVTKKEYMSFHKAACDKMVAITKAKNADYCGTNPSPFANFAKHGELGFLVRMHDKIARVESFVSKGFLKVKDESVLDTLFDLANYSILLAGFITSKGDTMAKKKKVVKKKKSPKKK